jgi:hypothetical protein
VIPPATRGDVALFVCGIREATDHPGPELSVIISPGIAILPDRPSSKSDVVTIPPQHHQISL